MKAVIEKLEGSDAADVYEFVLPGDQYDGLRGFMAEIIRHDVCFMESSGVVVLRWKIEETGERSRPTTETVRA